MLFCFSALLRHLFHNLAIHLRKKNEWQLYTLSLLNTPRASVSFPSTRFFLIGLFLTPFACPVWRASRRHDLVRAQFVPVQKPRRLSSASKGHSHHSSNLSLAPRGGPRCYVCPVDRTYLSIQPPLLCGNVWRMAVSSAGTPPRHHLVLLDLHHSHCPRRTSFPPRDAEGACSTTGRKEIASRWETADA